MNVLITGANGQLGSSIRKLASRYPNHKYTYTDQEDLDITDQRAIEYYIDEYTIEAIINCAAYTAVDKAEEDQELAFLINESGPKNIARACEKKNCYFIHISTEYVFSGKAYIPYIPTDQVNPISIYAKSKAAGEIAVRESEANAIIIRTSWLYSEFGHNFVKTMLNLSKTRDELNIVADQIGSPTYAGDLAEAILQTINQVESGKVKLQAVETYHYANAGCASWYDFTKAIVDIANNSCVINPIPTEEYPLPATRPHYSVMNTSHIRNDFGIKIPYWRDSLKIASIYC